jgi:hypothetical protein
LFIKKHGIKAWGKVVRRFRKSNCYNLRVDLARTMLVGVKKFIL